MKAVKIGNRATCINWGENDGLEKMYREIGCDLVEFIDLPKLSKVVFDNEDEALTMVMDEEGKLKDVPMYNLLATALYVYEYGFHDFIAGKALLMKAKDGETQPLNDEEIRRVRYILRHKTIRSIMTKVSITLMFRGQVEHSR